MTVAVYLVAILGLAVLMVVHEGGHYLAARRFGMRVVRFSIGFGPTIWKHKPKDSPTDLPGRAHSVPRVRADRGDEPVRGERSEGPGELRERVALWARIVTIAAGPLTNYFFASVLIFFGLLIGDRGADEATMRVVVEPGPAQVAGMQTGDASSRSTAWRCNWDELRKDSERPPGRSDRHHRRPRGPRRSTRR